MALHTQLPIYKVTYDLTQMTAALTGRYPRNLKPLGSKMLDLCIELVTAIYQANCAIDKKPHLSDLIERLQVLELQYRLSRDLRCVSVDQYAKAIALTGAVGKQANGWRKAYA